MRHFFCLLAVAISVAGCDGLSKTVEKREADLTDTTGSDTEPAADTEGREDSSPELDVEDTGDVLADTAADTVADTAADTAADVDATDTGAFVANGCGGSAELRYRGAPASPGDGCGLCGDGELFCSGTSDLSCAGAGFPNVCGGCGPLEGEVGTACGLCNDGVWACGAGQSDCVGDRAPNGCGGCAALELEPGTECALGTGEAGVVVCSGRELSRCASAGTNGCGGNGPLALPAGVTGVEPRPGVLYQTDCRRGVLLCDGAALVAFDLEGGNACGGCEPLPGAPGTTCGACGGVWTCDAEGGAECVGGALNGCGGCEVLADAPGTTCDAAGSPGVRVCISLEETACVPPGSTNACGGLGTLTGAALGDSCGSCDDGVVVCDAADPRRRSTVCETVSSTANACGGCGLLEGSPGGACGTCGLGQLACNVGGDGLDCTGNPGASALNLCGGCATLSAAPGDACGRCGTWECDLGAVGRLKCAEPAVGCAAAAICGNGRVEVGESCDDGNAATEACTYGDLSCEVCDAACALVAGATAFCGDGSQNGAEVCDDGNAVTEACNYGETGCTVCDASCGLVPGATAYCGDGVTTVGESCDDGNAVTETCAYGDLSCEVCDATCALVDGETAYCGDGSQNGDEVCDDGNAVTEACIYGETGCTVCDASCGLVPGATAYCGDGIETSGESCDDGNAVTEACSYGATDCVVCSSTCRRVSGATAYCGDGSKNGAELCDPVLQPATCDSGCACLAGNHPEENGCVADTRLCDVPYGTGSQVWSGSWAACVADWCEPGFSLLRGACIATGCGNEVVESGEACDDGNLTTEACLYGQTACLVCDSGCQFFTGETAFCGDGFVDATEGCDDANTVTESCAYESGSCSVCGSGCASVAAAARRCGDGITDAEEECDDGNMIETDACFSTCTSPRLTPPSGVSATDGNYTEFVMVSWTAVPGATGYHVYRDGIRITGAPTTFTTYPDVGADAPTPFGSPTNVRATTTDSTKVRVTWTAPTTAAGTVHQYAVSTVGVVEGEPSSPDAGNRGAYLLLGYQMSINDAAWFDLPLTTTYDHSAAPAATINVGSGYASTSSPWTSGRMTCPAPTFAAGENQSYRIAARVGGVTTPTSSPIVGFRSIQTTSASYQWYYNSGVLLSGCTGLSCNWGCSFGCNGFGGYMRITAGSLTATCSTNTIP